MGYYPSRGKSRCPRSVCVTLLMTSQLRCVSIRRSGFSVERDASPAFASVVPDGVRLLPSGDGSSGKRPLTDGRQQVPGG